MLRRAVCGCVLLAAMATLTAAAHGAGRLELALPLRCEPGRDCWIVNYVDVDPGAGARDYNCGHMTYNGHSGTDFAVRDLKAMGDGVAVLAAAGGVVRAVRDGVTDISVREGGREAIERRECGNGVRIEHAGGWSTQYCHLREGSVAVKPGEAVAAGAPLGLVGLSGKTEFPHVHLTVRHGKQVVDPFHGLDPPAGCGAGAASLWSAAAMAALAYTRGAVHNFGAAAAAPDAEEARRGAYRDAVIPATAPVLAIWAEAYGALPGDAVQFELTAPGGATVISHRATIARQQVRIFRWAGRKRPAADWPPGKYHGKIRYLSQDDPRRTLSAVEFTVEVR